jgi:small GTP-binding protein
LNIIYTTKNKKQKTKNKKQKTKNKKQKTKNKKQKTKNKKQKTKNKKQKTKNKKQKTKNLFLYNIYVYIITLFMDIILQAFTSKDEPKESIRYNKNYDILVKVITLGDCYVGKSTFLQALYNHPYLYNYRNIVENEISKYKLRQYESTIGVDFGAINIEFSYYELYNTKTPTSSPQITPQITPQINPNNDRDNVRIKANIWDTAGQERFLSITRTYFKNTCGVLLMFDLTNRTTFINIQKWINTLEEEIELEYIYITLIGNKSDLKEKRQVTQLDINTFLQNNQKLHIEYFECCCIDIERPMYILKKHLTGIFMNRYRLPHGINYQNKKYNVHFDIANNNNNENENSSLQKNTNIFSCITKIFQKN